MTDDEDDDEYLSYLSRNLSRQAPRLSDEEPEED